MLQLTDLNADGDAMDPGEQTTLFSFPSGDDPSVVGYSVVPAGTFGPTCVDHSIDDSGLDSATPAPWVFTFEDIPAASQTGTELGVVLVSLSGDGPTVCNTCTVGLDFDFFTDVFLLFLPVMSTQITASTATTPGFPAVQFPLGLKLYYVAGVLGPNAAHGGISLSQSRSVVVQ